MSLDTVPTLVLTRDAAGCAAWALRLRDLGARPISFPCLEIRDLERPGVQAELQRALAASSWLCLTSPRGVEALRVRVDALPAALRIAAVGPATAARVRERFGRVDVEAGQLPGTGATARGLAEALLARGEDLGHVVLVTADRGRRELESRLGDRGVSVERFELYRTVPTPPHGPRRDLRQVLAERR
ncbi:MAG: uroporphyrinogen-III synthase, partial [Acidobacteriota bacterium]